MKQIEKRKSGSHKCKRNADIKVDINIEETEKPGGLERELSKFRSSIMKNGVLRLEDKQSSAAVFHKLSIILIKDHGSWARFCRLSDWSSSMRRPRFTEIKQAPRWLVVYMNIGVAKRRVSIKDFCWASSDDG